MQQCAPPMFAKSCDSVLKAHEQIVHHDRPFFRWRVEIANGQNVLTGRSNCQTFIRLTFPEFSTHGKDDSLKLRDHLFHEHLSAGVLDESKVLPDRRGVIQAPVGSRRLLKEWFGVAGICLQPKFQPEFKQNGVRWGKVTFETI